MKKLLLALSFCVALMLAVNPSASADEKLCGRAVISYINLYESNGSDVPTFRCEMLIDFTTENGQLYTDVPVKARGTQINLACLKAWNEDLNVSMCLRYRWIAITDPVTGKITYQVEAEVINVDFDEITKP